MIAELARTADGHFQFPPVGLPLQKSIATGHETHNVDGKYRITIPTGLRDWLKEHSPGSEIFYILPAQFGENLNFLALMPIDTVTELLKDIPLNSQPLFFARNIATTDFDAQGRIACRDHLPVLFDTEEPISKPVVIAGCGNFIMIIRPQNWEALIPK